MADYLVDHAKRDYGVEMGFISGDSAGAHLSVVTTYHLLESRSEFAFKGLVLNFGAYDLSGFLPQAWLFKLPLVLDVEIMQKFIRPLSLSSMSCDTDYICQIHRSLPARHDTRPTP